MWLHLDLETQGARPKGDKRPIKIESQVHFYIMTWLDGSRTEVIALLPAESLANLRVHHCRGSDVRMIVPSPPRPNPRGSRR